MKVVQNSAGKNVYQINGVQQPFLTLKEGDTYYFDLSDSSLYNADASNRHILRFSETSDGIHGGGSEYTTGVTKSESYIAAGTTGAYIQIKVAVGTPSPLYYYCTNHSGMGGEIRIIERVDVIQDEGGNVLLDATDVSISAILLEDGIPSTSSLYEGEIGFELRQETLMPTRSSHIRLNQSDVGGVDQNENIILESGVDTSGTSVILSESDDRVELEGIDNKGDRFLLEVTTLSDFSGQTSSTNKAAQRDNENEKLLLNRYQENDITSLLISEDALGNRFIGTEEQGINLVLNRTDLVGASGTFPNDTGGSNANENFLLDDKTGNGNINLDRSDSDGADAGDDIINESGIDFSNKNVTITDSSGASGTIVKADIGTAISTVDTTSTNVGEYSGVTSLLGEDLIRIQDSYYYQDYSYEVQVGQSFSTYVNELKKAVHPAGFQPFGKVTLATLVSARLGTTAAGVSGYTGDTTFSPILASTLQTIFKQIIQSRLEVPSTDTADGIVRVGDRDNQITLEDGDSILYEDKTVTHTSDVTYGVGDGGGRMMNENSFTPSGTGDKVIVKEIFSRVVARPTPRRNRNLLIYLAETPFGNTSEMLDDIILDGTLPLDSADTFFQLERDVKTDNILLDGTSAAAADSGDSVLLEDGFVLRLEDQQLGFDGETFNIASEEDSHSRILQEGGEWNFPIGFVVNENENLLLEENDNEDTIPLSEIGHFQFSDILRRDKLIIQDGRSGPFDIEPNAEVGILMESAGQILLDGTSITTGGDTDIVENENNHLLQETTLRNRFDLEENGALVVESYQTNSVVEVFVTEVNEDNLVFEDATTDSFYGDRGQHNVGLQNFSIKLEYGEGNIILDSHGIINNLTYDLGEGDELLLEEDFVVNLAISSEVTNKIVSEGQIPFNNLTLNSNEILRGYNPIVRSADIKVRDTGDITLEDATDTTHGYLVFNSTSGSNTNAGESIRFEGGTARAL